MDDEIDYDALQDSLRLAWEELEYAHMWLIASEWDSRTSMNDKLSSAQQKAHAYTQLVDRIAWTMRK
jgi:hypothetical protein